MERSLTEDEVEYRKQARRRLMGAAVLVLLVAAILPPMMATVPRQDAQVDRVVLNIPSQGGVGEFDPKQPAGSVKAGESRVSPALTSAPLQSAESTANLPADSEATSAKRAQANAGSVPAKPAPATKPEPVVKPAAAGKSAEAVKPSVQSRPAESRSEVKPQADSASQAGSEKYLLRLGAFSDPERAKKRLAELKTQGIRAYSEEIKTPAGIRIRVRAGPFGSQQEAEKLRERLSGLKMDSDVVRAGSDRQ